MNKRTLLFLSAVLTGLLLNYFINNLKFNKYSDYSCIELFNRKYTSTFWITKYNSDLDKYRMILYMETLTGVNKFKLFIINREYLDNNVNVNKIICPKQLLKESETLKKGTPD